MPGSKKVSAQMSTSVALDTLKAAESLKSLRTAVQGVTNAWKAQASALKSAGDSQGALQAKVNGLKETQEAELRQIQALINKQKDLDVTTQKGAEQYTKYQNQINRLVSSYEKQNVEIDKAKQSLNYYKSGLSKLQEEYQQNNRLSQSFVERLRAEGREEDAQKEKLKGLQSGYKNLKQQYDIQERELNKIGDTLGKTSNQYKTQQQRLNKTATEMAKTKTQANELSSSLEKNSSKFSLFSRKAEESSHKTSGFTTSLKGTAIGMAAYNTAATAVSLVTNQIGDAVTRVDTLNNSKRTFANMGFSAKDTKKAMDGLNNSIKGLPTGLDEAVKGVQMFATTTNGDLPKAQKVWSSVNDAVIGFGGTTEQVTEATTQLSQAFSNGKVDAQTWNSMMNANLGPTLNAIAKDMGKTTAQLKSGLSDGSISVKQFQDELIKLDTKGGGGLKSLSKIAHDSTSGIGTSIKNATTSITRGLGDMIVKFSDALQKITGSNLSQWITKFGSIAEKTLGNIGKSMDKVGNHTSKIKGVINSAVKVVKAALSGLKPIINAVKDSFKKLGGNTDSLKKTMNGLAPIVKVISNVIGTVLGGAIKIAIGTIIDLCKVFNTVSGWIGKLHKGFNDFAKNSAKTFISGWNSMKSNMGKAVDAMTNKNSKLHDEMISKISDATGVSKTTLNNAYKTMGDYTQTWKDLMTGKWDKLGGDIKHTASDLSSTAKSMFSDMYNKLNDLTGGGLDKIKNGWDKLWKNIISGIKSAVANVGHEVSNLVNNVIKPVNDMLDGVKSGVNWVLDKFGASKWSGFKIPLVHFATGGEVGKDGTMAMVNDSGTSNYREMFATPDGRVGAFPKQRNLITYLPKGTQILDGENSKALAEMMDIPHFKDGTKDKNIFEKIFDKGKDIMENIGDIISHPIKFMEKVLKKYLHVSTGIKFASTLISHAPSFFAKQAEKWLKKMAEDFKKSMESTGGNGVSYGNANNPGGAGVQRWKPVIIEAFKNLGQNNPPDWKVQKLLRQIATESGGNPNAHQGNIGDINNLRGTPAQGLLQFVPSTFASWSRPGHNNIYSGLDQLMAAIYCLDHGGEGGWGNIGNGHGWENGGFVDKWSFGQIAEHNKPEVVIPLSPEKQGRALDLLTGTVNRLNHNAGRNTRVVSNTTDGVLESKLDTMINLLANILGVNQEQLNKTSNTGNLNAFYQQMQRDQSINNYQAF